MYTNTYNLHGQAFMDAFMDNERQRAADLAAMRRNHPDRVALRRLIAYLAIRWDPAWLAASEDILEGYLPVHWQVMAHHELVTYLDVQGITPEHCQLL